MDVKVWAEREISGSLLIFIVMLRVCLWREGVGRSILKSTGRSIAATTNKSSTSHRNTGKDGVKEVQEGLFFVHFPLKKFSKYLTYLFQDDLLGMT